MRKNTDHLERYRIKIGPYGSTKGLGPVGAFIIPFESYDYRVVATDGKGTKPQWEHVSVSLKNKCPNWKAMCYMKDLFWGEDETVVQFHPKKSEYVNMHPYTLHLWKRVPLEIDLPPAILVGFNMKEKK